MVVLAQLFLAHALLSAALIVLLAALRRAKANSKGLNP